MPAVLASTCPEPAAGVSWSLTQVLYIKTENPARFVFAQICQGWICAAWAVLGPWCEIYLALGLEQGLLVEFRKDLRPEGRLPDYWERNHGMLHTWPFILHLPFDPMRAKILISRGHNIRRLRRLVLSEMARHFY